MILKKVLIIGKANKKRWERLGDLSTGAKASREKEKDGSSRFGNYLSSGVSDSV